MERKEFLKSLGGAAALAVTFSCLGGCSRSDVSTSDDDTDTDLPFTVDLSATASSALLDNGGYIIMNNTVVAKDLSGNYVAATNLCSHEAKRLVIFQDGEYYCTDHGARFDLTGDGLNDKGSGGLTIYQTSLDGDTLTVSA